MGHTNGGNSRDNFTQLQLVKDGGFSGSVQTDHENSHLLLPPQLIKDLGKCETHGGDIWGFVRRSRRYIKVKGGDFEAGFDQTHERQSVLTVGGIQGKQKRTSVGCHAEKPRGLDNKEIERVEDQARLVAASFLA